MAAVKRAVRQLLAVGGISGEVEPLERVLREIPATSAPDAVAVVGDLGAPWSKPHTYRAIFQVLGETTLPVYWVPGLTDAPLRDYLREAYNMEIVYPSLHGVHGTAAVGSDHIVFAGMGGEIVDDPDALRSEEALLRYPGWEVEYRLKVIREFEDHQKVFLFTTPPAHKGLRQEGSETLAELIKTWSPRVAIIAGEQPRQEPLGSTLVVCPGRVDRGEYALIDLRGRSAAIAVLVAARADPGVVGARDGVDTDGETAGEHKEGGNRMSQVLPERRSEATPERWDPIAEIGQITERMRRMLTQTLGGGGWTALPADGTAWSPLVDIEEDDDAYVVEAELPGVKREDVTIEFVGNELSIAGELKEQERKGVLRRQTRRRGRFAYRVSLPESVDADHVEATLSNGVLTVRVPKAERAQRRRVEVKAT
jgi:HSP20 family molecular chaperone IbpA/Icc-related predicted phosphoesterase